MPGNDRKALLQLLLSNYEDLTRLLTRRLGSPDQARDAVHDTYLRLQKLDTVPEINNPRAYVFRIASNIALDRLRAEGRRNARFVSEEFGAGVASADPQADMVLEQRRHIDILSKAINDMPPRQREVFLLHKFDGLSHSAIAEKLGISRSMVEKHMMRALSLCRNRLER